MFHMLNPYQYKTLQILVISKIFLLIWIFSECHEWIYVFNTIITWWPLGDPDFSDSANLAHSILNVIPSIGHDCSAILHFTVLKNLNSKILTDVLVGIVGQAAYVDLPYWIHHP